jgi:glutamyl-tRNA reductase
MRGPVTRPALVMVGASGADRTDRGTTVSAENVARLLSELRGVEGVHETAILSTCHRLEIYLVADDESGAVETVVGRGLGRWHAAGTIAASHLLRVACGLESPILGDGQILGQVRRAYEAARAARTTGPWLNKLFETALCAGKRARQTSVGRGATTAASAAVQLAQRRLGIEGRQVLIVGAGETAALAARHAARHRPAGLVIANRGRVHAERVAAPLGATVIGLDALEPALSAADLVVSATARGAIVVSAQMLERAMAARRARPLLAIDLAVPGDIEPTVELVPGVTRLGLDDVMTEADAGLRLRLTSVLDVEAIVADRLRALEDWHTGRAAIANASPVRGA